MKHILVSVAIVFSAFPALAELKAGASTVSINPLEKGIPTQLGGYGERAAKPAEGTHDTINAKTLLLESGDRRFAIVTLDVCSVPICAVQESIAKAGLKGLTIDNVVMIASHTHGGLEGASLDRRNVADNPHIGLFNEEILNFFTDRLAEGLRNADAQLQPVRVGSGVLQMPGFNTNRRDDPFLDEDMTVLRLDRADGKPYVVLVNFTAHGTIMTEKEMMVCGDWAGVMQRTVEAVFGPETICMYTNGAEGDVAPTGYKGGSRYEMAEDYGRRVGLKAAAFSKEIGTREEISFENSSEWIDLPQQKGSPDFVKIAGEEYRVTQEQLDALLPVLFPSRAPIYSFRLGDFQIATFPGEAVCKLGMDVKQAMRAKGIKYPCVSSLANDSIGYILTREQYLASGYEATASFYGDGLGDLMLERVRALAIGVK